VSSMLPLVGEGFLILLPSPFLSLFATFCDSLILPTFGDRPQHAIRVSDAWWDENREAVVERVNLWLLE
jgi:hypothetical protein